jgi:cell division transport system permease protein
VSIITITTVLFVFNLFLIIGFSTNNLVTGISNIQTIRVYLESSDNKTINELKEKILSLNSVEKVEYFSPEKTYQRLKNTQINSKYLKLIPKDLFPDFIEVTIKEQFRDLKYIRDIESQLNGLENVNSASYGESWILNFISFKFGIQMFLTLLAVLLGLAMCFIIYNTIKISLYQYKEEIQIYNLVGATRSFIIVPFIFTSFLEVFLSFLFSTLIGIFILKSVNHYILESLDISFFIIPGFFIYCVYFLLLIVVSILSGYLSVNSFLNKMGTINE